jgi:competence protein ComEA
MKTRISHALTAIALAFAFVLPAQTPTPASPHSAAHSVLVDINTATADRLLALPGMGHAYVQRVIAGRPYTAKNQLLTRGILPETAYEKIAPKIVAKRVPKS